MVHAKEKRPFRLPPPLVPAELAGLEVTCHHCRLSFRPIWYEPLEFPVTPIVPHTGNGYFIPMQAKIRCPHCRQITDIELPIVDVKAWVNFYGDEAFRHIGSKYLATYSLVGGEPHTIDNLVEALKALKQEFVPDHDPTDWSVHMKDLTSSKERNRNDIYRTWDLDKASEFVRRVAEITRERTDKLWILNMASIVVLLGPAKRKKLYSFVRDQVFSGLLLYTINEVTKQGGRPFFTFDATRQVKSYPHVEGWAEESFLGSQYSLTYGFVSRGIPIDKPGFVQPGSHPCLEIADFVSYYVARYIERRLSKKNVDYDPGELGNINYLTFDVHGNLRDKRDSTYPWEMFFGKQQKGVGD